MWCATKQQDNITSVDFSVLNSFFFEKKKHPTNNNMQSPKMGMGVQPRTPELPSENVKLRQLLPGEAKKPSIYGPFVAYIWTCCCDTCKRRQIHIYIISEL